MLVAWHDDAFPKGISPKVNIIVRQEFELTYCDVTIYNVSHNDTTTPPHTHKRNKWRISKYKGYLEHSFIYFLILNDMFISQC